MRASAARAASAAAGGRHRRLGPGQRRAVALAAERAPSSPPPRSASGGRVSALSYVPGQLQLSGSPLLDVLTIRYCILSCAVDRALQILRGRPARVQQEPGGQPGRQRAQADVAGAEQPGEESFASFEHACHRRALLQSPMPREVGDSQASANVERSAFVARAAPLPRPTSARRRSGPAGSARARVSGSPGG